MKPHELIRALVAEAGGAFTVAKAMRRPGFQGTLHKICAGNVASPARASAERIAAHFNIPVDAVYDAAVAERTYRERFGTTHHVVRSPAPATYRARTIKPPLSAEAEAFARWYDSMSPEEQHKARLMMWVVKPGVNPTHIPAPGLGHKDEADSGLSNLDPPSSDRPRKP